VWELGTGQFYTLASATLGTIRKQGLLQERHFGAFLGIPN